MALQGGESFHEMYHSHNDILDFVRKKAEQLNAIPEVNAEYAEASKIGTSLVRLSFPNMIYLCSEAVFSPQACLLEAALRQHALCKCVKCLGALSRNEQRNSARVLISVSQ